MTTTPNLSDRQKIETLSPAVRRDIRFRRVILGILFIATFLNYFDHQTILVLEPVIKAKVGLDNCGYAHIHRQLLMQRTHHMHF
jgi:hypothetical protein